MSTKIELATPWNWIPTPTKSARANKADRQELWAGAVYLMVWSVLWLAVIVTVLAPLDGLFGGAR